MSDKTRFPLEDARKVARWLCVTLADHCVRLECAGSIRRGKPTVGDIEIVYIPELATRAVDFFASETVSCVDLVLDDMLARGIIAKRKNVNGSEMWGQKNKLAVHVASGIPVDFFATTEAAWFNYLVCRTGGAQSNMAIALAAQRRGWKWNPYGAGFTNHDGELVPVRSERDVFELVGLPYLDPCDRQ
jgi:DNA polymerase (family 10)